MEAHHAPTDSFEALAARMLDAGHRFTLRGWRGEPSEVFVRAAAETRRARGWWMREHPERHRLALQHAAPLVEATLALARTWHPDFSPVEGASAELALHLLGSLWETDFVLLAPRAPGGPHHFEAGVVCHPSGWAPETKLGRTLHEVHGPVPGLNEELSEGIELLLQRLPADGCWQRVNWGLSTSGEPNQHPARGVARPGPDTPPEALWWRVEHQALLRLPGTDGILFGIRVLSFPLLRVREHRELARALASQLDSMPAPLLHYKAIEAVASPAAAWLCPFGRAQRPAPGH